MAINAEKIKQFFWNLRKPVHQRALLRAIWHYMPWNLFGDIGDYIAVDISSSDIKLLSLSCNGKQYQIDLYARMPLADGIVEEQEIIEPEAITLALKRLLNRLEIMPRYAVAALPMAQCITKIVQTDYTDDPIVIENVIEHIAERNLSTDLDELALDYVVLGKNNLDEEKMDILFVASQTKNVANCVEIIESAGLEVKILDIEAYALARSVELIKPQIPEKIYRKGNVAIMDLGASIIQLCVLEKRELIYSADEEFGGAQLTHRIQKRYGLSQEQAELAQSQNKLPEDYQQEILQPFKESLAQHAKRMLQYCFSSTNLDSVDILILSGGVAAIKDLAEFLTEYLHLPVIIADPCAYLKLSDEVNSEFVKEDSPSLMLSLGLAMRGVS